eukprot:TRINITY_DN12594_c0_g1_i1.p1 TRINITY_DN12594_c0_g1~~TRINITY_DN12594_c0_g1_i1.p1  ORF type:complete len:288 (-),score=82.27 TRINITY_DN12594_c0_g1_i1:266-1129(-)
MFPFKANQLRDEEQREKVEFTLKETLQISSTLRISLETATSAASRSGMFFLDEEETEKSQEIVLERKSQLNNRENVPNLSDSYVPQLHPAQPGKLQQDQPQSSPFQPRHRKQSKRFNLESSGELSCDEDGMDDLTNQRKKFLSLSMPELSLDLSDGSLQPTPRPGSQTFRHPQPSTPTQLPASPLFSLADQIFSSPPSPSPLYDSPSPGPSPSPSPTPSPRGSNGSWLARKRVSASCRASPYKDKQQQQLTNSPQTARALRQLSELHLSASPNGNNFSINTGNGNET